MSEKIEIREYICWLGADDFTGDLDKVINLLQSANGTEYNSLLLKRPCLFSRFELADENGPDGGFHGLELYGYRFETDDEQQKRLGKEQKDQEKQAAQQEKIVAKEKEKLQELAQKYGFQLVEPLKSEVAKKIRKNQINHGKVGFGQ